MLELRDIHAFYGPIEALKGASPKLSEGQIVAVLGANGAGKTTLMNTISGLVRAKRGQIRFAGQAIERWRPERVVRAGISQVPAGRQIFPELTVAENLRMGAYVRRDREGIRADHRRVLDYFPRLRERLKQPAGTLSGGGQQMLAIARALMARPKLLLLDEPSLGLAPVLVRQLFEILGRLHQEGAAMLLAEQNAHMALQLADYAYVLTLGAITLAGSARQLQANDQVRRLYLGMEGQPASPGGDQDK